jgi:hypothetical protein
MVRFMDIEPGMTKWQVPRLLGRPHGRRSTREMLREYQSVVVLGPVSNREYWHYMDVPPGHLTMIEFVRSRVSEATSRSSDA